MQPRFDNLDVFLSLDDFAVEARITLQDGSEREVSGIFDDPFLNAQLGEYELETSQPRLTCRADDVVGVQRRDRVEINGTTMDVMSAPETDGTGMAVLRLARRSE